MTKRKAPAPQTAPPSLAAERVARLTGRQRRIDPEIAAKEVLDILIELDGDLITYDELAKVTEMTKANVMAGVVYLKDEVLGVEGVSFVSEIGRGGGIALTRDANRAMAFVLFRARMARKQMQRLIDGTITPMAQYAKGTDVQGEAEAIKRNHGRVLEDLDAMVQRLDDAGVDVAKRRPPEVNQRSVG